MPSPANTHDPTAGRFFVIAGSLLGALAVMVGAFGAHALSGMLTAEQLATFEIAVRYQMYHSIALILTGVIRHMLDVPAIRWAGMAFFSGILIFSGSLYFLVLADLRWLGAVTPIGGIAFVMGWLCLAVAYWKAGPGADKAV